MRDLGQGQTELSVDWIGKPRKRPDASGMRNDRRWHREAGRVDLDHLWRSNQNSGKIQHPIDPGDCERDREFPRRGVRWVYPGARCACFRGDWPCACVFAPQARRGGEHTGNFRGNARVGGGHREGDRLAVVTLRFFLRDFRRAVIVIPGMGRRRAPVSEPMDRVWRR